MNYGFVLIFTSSDKIIHIFLTTMLNVCAFIEFSINGMR